MFGYSRQHSRSKFVAIMKGKYKIGPIETLHGSMRSALALDSPTELE